MRSFLFCFAFLLCLAHHGFAQQGGGHWEADGTPEIESGSDSPAPFNGWTAGTTASASVTADGNHVFGRATAYSGSIFESAQMAASRGGKFYEKFRWVGYGLGRAGCMGEVDTFVSMNLTAASGASVQFVRAESNVWDEPLSQDIQVSHASASAPVIGSIQLPIWDLVKITLPIPTPGGNITESYNEDHPSENLYGEKCSMKFWHKRLTFGYVNVLTRGTMGPSGYACVSICGKVSSSPSLMGPCDSDKREEFSAQIWCNQCEVSSAIPTCVNYVQ